MQTIIIVIIAAYTLIQVLGITLNNVAGKNILSFIQPTGELNHLVNKATIRVRVGLVFYTLFAGIATFGFVHWLDAYNVAILVAFSLPLVHVIACKFSSKIKTPGKHAKFVVASQSVLGLICSVLFGLGVYQAW